jgi:hypothetical protein
MNARARKKARERHFFEHAQALLPDVFTDGEIDAHGETPDIIVRSTSLTYGVEISEMVRQSAQARNQAEWSICREAQTRFGVPSLKGGLKVQAAFLDSANVDKRNWKTAAADLLGIVTRLLPPSSDATYSVNGDCYEHFQSAVFRRVWLHYHPRITNSIWQPVKAWWVPTLSAESIAEKIASKELRLSAYKQRATAVYLLLVIYGFDGASAAAVSDELLNTVYQTKFDGVVLLDFTMQRAHALNTCAPCFAIGTSE